MELEIDGVRSWWEGRVTRDTGLGGPVVTLKEAVFDDESEGFVDE